MLRQTIETLALRTGLFDPLRSAYHIVANRPYYHKLKARQALFAPFIKPGDLVFDIGANQGDFALCYKRLGASVVCVEPNPALAAKLRARFGAAHVVEAAVSDAPGSATLYLGSDSNYSTIVPSWLGITKERNRLSDQAVTVRVTTLDTLLATYGRPAFIKIDVEANELPVLRGLSQAIPLMFEYQCPRLEEVPLMLDHLEHLGAYRFCLLAHGQLSPYTRAQLLTTLHAIRESGQQSGDVYCLQ